MKNIILLLFTCTTFGVYGQNVPYINKTKDVLIQELNNEKILKNTQTLVIAQNGSFTKTFYIKNDTCTHYKMIFNDTTFYNAFEKVWSDNKLQKPIVEIIYMKSQYSIYVKK